MKRLTFQLLECMFCLALLASCQAPGATTPTPATVDSTSSAKLTPLSTPIKPAAIKPTRAACNETAGFLQELDLSTGQDSEAVKIKIYLPPCYTGKETTGYPVLYLLHGQGADNNQWVTLGITRAADALINSGQISPLIMVFPTEQDTLQAPEDSVFTAEIIETVIPFIDEHYAVCDERSCRAIGGLSRGGNWAVALGFAHPELFTAVGAHSTPLFYGQAGQIRKSTAAMSSPADAPFLYIDVGDKDSYYADVASFVSTLDDLRIPYKYTEFTGKHEAAYWSAHVSDYLQWYSASLIQPKNSPRPTPTP